MLNCHNTGHFARECTAKGTHHGKKKRDSFYQHQEAGKQEKNQMGLLIIDDGIVNWGEHTAVEETNHALMAISSSNEVTLCSKTCIDSYNTLKLLCDEQMNQLGDQEAQILAYSQAVKKLEAQLECNQHPLSGDYTPSPQDEIDESLYVYGKKGPQEPEPSVSDDRSSEFSTQRSQEYLQKFKYLIKDCVYYKKKKEREAEVKRVVNTSNGMAKPVWTNANRVNHSNKFVPRSVQLNAGRPNINSVRPNINTGRTNINSVRPRVNAVSSNVNIVRI
ncbi:hypothetical protein Tco_0464790 [Tanacetum coccineum]